MKKTLSAVLIGILAIVLIGYAAFLIKDKNQRLDVDASLSDNGSSSSTSEKSPFFSEDNSSYSENSSSSEADTTTQKAPEEISEEIVETVVNADDYAYSYAGFMPAYANMEVSDWRLILVNRDYILPDGYKPKLANAVEGGYDDMYLDERVAPYYNEMYKAAYEDGIHLVPISGYRSVQRQTNNFERKINTYMDMGYDKVEATQKAATVILPPGTSEHNAGLAMDICSLEQNFEETEEFEWLCENAADYGFILRYPEDKQDITKIIYEPWHWRYVGVEAAKEMEASGECLEEYLGIA